MTPARPEREGGVARLTDRREPDSIKIARIETVVNGMGDDIAEIKVAVNSFKREVDYLGDVRVRGLEEREIRRKAVEDERARAADAARAAAEEAARSAREVKDDKKHQISRRDLWATAFLFALVTLLAALIASGHLL